MITAPSVRSARKIGSTGLSAAIRRIAPLSARDTDSPVPTLQPATREHRTGRLRRPDARRRVEVTPEGFRASPRGHDRASDCPLVKEAPMYIGLGTVLVILLILLVIGVLR
jgi:hypothetical protein